MIGTIVTLVFILLMFSLFLLVLVGTWGMFEQTQIGQLFIEHLRERKEE